MTERDACGEARRALALGLREGAESHLELCEPCRRVAAEVAPLLASLAGSAPCEPPEAVDRRVRALLAKPPPSRVVALRPVPALLTAVLALLLVGTALALALSQTRLGGDAPLVAAYLVTAYLGMAATATLPLLLLQRNIVRALLALRVKP